MRIVQLAYLPGHPVPPPLYGGIERMVATLTRELVNQGHEVTLIAPPGSRIPDVSVIETTDFKFARDAIHLIKPDIVHDHSCWRPESPVRFDLGVPFISTTHVNHAIGWSKNVVYLSHDQRDHHYQQLCMPTLAKLRETPVIRVPTDPCLKPSGIDRQDFLLYLGSVAPYKGVHRAADLARALNVKLVVAGPAAGDYADKIAALPHVVMAGEVGDPYRSYLLEAAFAVCCLHGNEHGWREPGCGVVGEAGAFNTPVIALTNGCLPEIVINGENGWIGADIHEVLDAMLETPVLQNPGRLAQTEWSAESIVKQYVSLYERIAIGYTWN